MSDQETTRELYRQAAIAPMPSLCCTPGPRFRLPGLSIPRIMEEMNYGCGTTVHLADLHSKMDILYVGVGGGLEALLFAYFTRRPASVLAVDSVPEMLVKARENLEQAARENDWFQTDFVSLLEGDALSLPLESECVDLTAQNCLFNIFTESDLTRALGEMWRVLKPGGRLVISDPICEEEIPERLRADERLRAQCLSGALPLALYIDRIVAAGFGQIEVRSRRPYRVLDSGRYGIPRDLLLESVELVAVKCPVPEDGPCVFVGETVIYVGDREAFDDGRGHIVARDVPLGVCRKTAAALRALGRSDLVVTPPTWHYAGGGCC